MCSAGVFVCELLCCVYVVFVCSASVAQYGGV